MQKIRVFDWTRLQCHHRIPHHHHRPRLGRTEVARRMMASRFLMLAHPIHRILSMSGDQHCNLLRLERYRSNEMRHESIAVCMCRARTTKPTTRNANYGSTSRIYVPLTCWSNGWHCAEQAPLPTITRRRGRLCWRQRMHGFNEVPMPRYIPMHVRKTFPCCTA